ncbi:hypothetical protein [Bartonella harrusi]|uniref:Uncharacterized protein n=1 Tax=Bartonella harrusi TaxID=2961895 RepID=A0ABY5EQT5_9HYPH|nr:hypothetical protein [Bartonella harrusi]UTO27752.1 hypothetical protein NMK50_05725 [Bartonella harrusi]
MTKLFKIYVLNIFIVIVFFLSQIVNVYANHLSNNAQREEIFLIEQIKEKVTRITTFDIPSLNYEGTNVTTSEGRVEKVVGPIIVTIGTFSAAALAGYATTTVSMLLGWIIKNLIRYF